MKLKLTNSVDKIPFIGEKYKNLLEKLKIYSIKDLIFHFPLKYRDTSKISLISDLNSEERRTIECQIIEIKSFRTRNRKYITEAQAEDKSGIIDIIWFNQPFLTKNLKPGTKVLLNGKLNPNRNKPQLYAPEYEVITKGESTHLGTIVPIYATTTSLSNKWLRSRIKYLFKNHEYLFEKIKTQLPQKNGKSYVNVNFNDALKEIHFPKDLKSAKRARKRVAFEELLAIQIKLVKQIKKRRKKRTPKLKVRETLVNKFLKSLPFKPTGAQKRVIKEIANSFKNDYPSNRLLQGDVGSGKTLVAAAVSLPVIESGFQVAILAPTAILAKQHYETISSLLKSQDIKLQLITGKTGKRKAKGEQRSVNIIIGTHALLHRQKDLFTNLGLVIVDEQHRFGVKQRETLIKKNKDGTTPHKITMTATPIPRSLTLTLFGDLDISIIDEMPRGRLPTKTYLVPHVKRPDAYKWIEKMTKGENVKGQMLNVKCQSFWLCPLIEESEKLQTKAVITEYGKLENEIFPNLRVDMLHGRLSEEEKNEKIKRMRDKKTDILVTTSVIEVGMDIPDANIIVIEGAERFGLAQLHQLRGRVGRKADQESWCFLFVSKNASSEAIRRLKYFSKTNDGMQVAEYDLKRRGPGEVYGTKQAGIPDLRIAKLTDLELVKKTREAAEEVINIKS